MANPNPEIDPVKPRNTRELREQIEGTRCLEESNQRTPGTRYTIINTAPSLSGTCPEPQILVISRDAGAPLRLPFDEPTPPQVDVQNWSLSSPGQRGPADAQAGEFNNQRDADAFYGLTQNETES